MIFPNMNTDPNFIQNLFCDTVVMLGVDEKWADEVLHRMNTAAYDLYGFDKVFDFAKGYYSTYGVAPQIDDYMASDSIEVRDIAETIGHREITQERAEEVKSAIRCWDSWRSLISIWNMIGDSIIPGVENDVRLDVVIDKVKKIADGIQHTRIITKKVEDEWV